MAQMTDDNQHLMQLLIFVENIYNDFIKQRKVIGTLSKFTALPPHTSMMTETGPYIAPELKNMINKLPFLYAETNYTYCNVRVSIKIHKPSSYPMKKITMIQELINFMIYYCKTVNTSFKDALDIKLILSPFKKELPSSGLLSAVNVNSGFTQRDYTTGVSSIVVYREEEVIKVLIHELLHAFDIDCKTTIKQDEQRFAKMFRLYTGVNINETFTDAYACMLNVVYCAILLSRSNPSFVLDDVFQTLMAFESLHILRMGHKILLSTMKQRKETTNVMAYYVLKAILWSRLDGFCRYLKDNYYKIGSCRCFATHMYQTMVTMGTKQASDFMDKLNHYIEQQRKVVEILNITLHNDAVRKQIKSVKLNSIRMSSIDIL